MGLLDDFLSSPAPVIDFSKSANDAVVRRDRCHVCDSLFTMVNPQFAQGSYWCTRCGDYFDGCQNEPTIHKMWYTHQDAQVDEPIGTFIGFAGYNQLLIDYRIEPKHVFTTHPREGMLHNKWYEEVGTSQPNNVRVRR